MDDTEPFTDPAPEARKRSESARLYWESLMRDPPVPHPERDEPLGLDEPMEVSA